MQDFGAFTAGGIDTFDTADHYGPSEQLIGAQALRRLLPARRLVIAAPSCLSGMPKPHHLLRRTLPARRRWCRGGRDGAHQGVHLGVQPGQRRPRRCVGEGEWDVNFLPCIASGPVRYSLRCQPQGLATTLDPSPVSLNAG